MLYTHDLLTGILMQEREREAERAAALSALLRGAHPDRDRRHTLRERLGFSLIQVGRALLRGPAYAAARRRLA